MAYSSEYQFSCKGCTKRFVGCHSVCTDYIEAKRCREEMKSRISEAKKREGDLNAFRREGVRKALRRS